MRPWLQLRQTRILTPAFGALVPLLFVAGLLIYKWTGSISTIRTSWSVGAIGVRAGVVEPGSGTGLIALERSLNYLLVIWPALIFGILIGAAVRSFVRTEWLARVLDGHGFRGRLKAGIAGAPLMLCSCCVAPVFSATYERTLRLAPCVALMLSSPLLNPAALALTFVLLSPKIAVARLLMAILAVMFAGAVVERLFPAVSPVRTFNSSADTLAAPGLAEGARHFVRSLGYIIVRTAPALAVGLLGSMLLAQYAPTSLLSSGTFQIVAIAGAAAVAVLLALPTFFEIPLALGLIAAGAPEGAALALLFAGPAVNLPSLLTLAKATNWKVALALAVFIWTIAVGGGLAAEIAG